MTMTEQDGKPTAKDYMLGTVLVIQDFTEKARVLKKAIGDFSETFSCFKDSKNITAYRLFSNLSQATESFDLVELHLKFACEAGNELFEKLKKVEEDK